tara:strand:- start:1575 stop:1733 length:159 start_codon:yes stop_codon:yes gene_type:complete
MLSKIYCHTELVEVSFFVLFGYFIRSGLRQAQTDIKDNIWNVVCHAELVEAQ